MVTADRLEKMAESLGEICASLKKERDELRDQCVELRRKLAEKELECLRLSRGQSQGPEVADERPPSRSAAVEEKIDALFDKLASLTAAQGGSPGKDGADDAGRRRGP